MAISVRFCLRLKKNSVLKILFRRDPMTLNLFGN